MALTGGEAGAAQPMSSRAAVGVVIQGRQFMVVRQAS
jgi:hypothetical protein